jgi:SAM-dependent methyltransferase
VYTSGVTDPTRSGASPGSAFDAPLSEERAVELVRRLVVAPGGHVLALGCGNAELLLRIVAAHPATTGTGVDRDRAALDRGRRRIAERGLLDRVDLVEADLAGFRDRADVVLCLDAERAWGGAEPALTALAGHVEPGGLVLLGARLPPGGLDELAALAGAASFRVLDASTATPSELAAWEGGQATGFGYLVLRPA